LNTKAKEDAFYFLTEKSSIRMPTVPMIHNEGNYIISLGQLCRWLAKQAEELGVEIYPGFAASEVASSLCYFSCIFNEIAMKSRFCITRKVKSLQLRV